MATATKLDFMQHVFRAPGCEDLPAHVQPTENGDLITSAWQLSPEELGKVASTGLVVVQFLGAQPPVFVTSPNVESPPEARFGVVCLDQAEGVPLLQDGDLDVSTATDALTVALSLLMKDAQAVTICRR